MCIPKVQLPHPPCRTADESATGEMGEGRVAAVTTVGFGL